MSQKRPRSPTPPPPSSAPPSNITLSQPLTDRSSTFIGAFSPTAPLSSLQSLPQLASATHKIAAWRLPSSQTTVSGGRSVEAGFDDDGERHGGKTVLKVLETEDVQGSLVVARWFGGVMLGPVRFDHLRNCARASVGEWRRRRRRSRAVGEELGGVPRGEGVEGEGEGERGKRVKLTEREWETEAERDRLIKELPERDGSIAVLRGLLAEKKKKGGEDVNEERVGEEAKGTGKAVEERGDGTKGVSHESIMPATPTRMAPAYEKMPLEALRKLEKVRDATIGWILKQIEDAEQKGEAQDGEQMKAG